ncbi:MAG: metallophosphoesterase [Elusimicrobiota bacterium]
MNNFKRIIVFFALLMSILSAGLYGKDVDTRIVAVGHFYSIQNFPEVRKIFVDEINAMEPDAVIFMGDMTSAGTMKDWADLNDNVLSKIKAPCYFAPGNHDLQREGGENAEENWYKNVGYTSKKVDLNNVELYLLNTVKGRNDAYDWTRTIQGYGLDKESLKLLSAIPADTAVNHKLRFTFMHHHPDINGMSYGKYEKYAYDTPESYAQDVMRHSKVWNDKVRPLIKNKINAVFSGDWSQFGPAPYFELDNIPYFRNSFGTCPAQLTTAGSPLLSYSVLDINNGNYNVIVKTLPVPFTDKWFYTKGVKK